MKLADTYANTCGVRVGGPRVFPELFFPTPEKYITIHNSSGEVSKDYEFYDEVIEILLPVLKDAGISILQVGMKDDVPLNNCFHFQGICTLRQSAYVIRNSMLHLGNDSLWAHYAGACKTPLVALYGVTQSENCAPYHHGAFVPIDSHRNGKRAGNCLNENPKTINFIKPEEAANAVLNLLGFGPCDRDTVHIGEFYNSKLVELVPDHVMPRLNGVDLVNVRMDYHFNEEFLAHNASLQNAISLFTDKAINIDLLKYYQGKISGLFYILDPSKEELDVDFVKDMHNSGIDYTLVTFEKDEDVLADLRYKLFDYKMIIVDEKKTDKPVEIKQDDLYSSVFKTGRNLISDGNLFPSKAHWMNNDIGKKDENGAFEIGDYQNSPEFWEQLNYYNIFNYVGSN